MTTSYYNHSKASTDSESIQEARSHLWPTYAPPDSPVFSHGKGTELYAEDGQVYLDFISGIAVTNLGHCHPELVKVVQEQAEKLWHLSNISRIPQAETLSKKLCDASFADAVFFSNSGAEAVEAGIKAIRGYHAKKNQKYKNRIIGFRGSFHGRTLGTIAAAGNPAHCQNFVPTDTGFDQVEWGNLSQLEDAITEKTAGILIEPIQGEGGIRPVEQEFLTALRELCNRNDLLLMFDEVQCGMGRSGYLFAHQKYNIQPDILASAKGLGGGFPVGACLATREVSDAMSIGTHGSTFGGNPLAMAVANKVLDIVLAEDFLPSVIEKSEKFKRLLDSLCARYPTVVANVYGEGLMLGVECVLPNTEILSLLRDGNLLVGKAGGNMIRLLPPLTVSEEEIDRAVLIMEECFKKASDGEQHLQESLSTANSQFHSAENGGSQK
ncbi:aspartate aminotransferase family protein [Sessilibacter corallicola]|uniref:aspartate aminotransferase family protein n=1 Tax=Sessilibacter corallicola TaxID=2904075 RepID=UPI001E55B8CC|nr:aspartate aminotransferase family protein [Sessilibacter corallicola]MCE2028318.1 aspartate aminotransferase family protein [Sessilibacter corallicola]